MRLCVHVGHGKTGSSFLQAWLAQQAPSLLCGNGIAYPLRAPVSGRMERAALEGRFSMGNGYVLEEALASWRPAWQLRQLAGDQPTLLFSGEQLIKTCASWLPRLVQLAPAAGIERVDLLLFVRDPLEHAHSLYGEMVKAHGYSGSLDQWISASHGVLPKLERFLALQAQMPTSHLCVHNYSRAPGQLLEQCGQWLGLPADAWTAPAAGRARVNRSLSQAELRLMRVLNARLGPAAAAVGRALVECCAAPAEPAVVAGLEAQASFIERLTPLVQQLNPQLPPAAQLRLERLWGRSAADDQAPLELSAQQWQCVLEALPLPAKPLR
jgi:hypothetical protein